MNKNMWLPFLGGVSYFIIISAVSAIAFERSDAIREMATGAFSGAIIGLIILFYEQNQEKIREDTQWNRDRKLAKRLRDDANLEADLRASADIILKEFYPAFSEYIFYKTYKVTHPREAVQLESPTGEIHHLIRIIPFYLKRITNDELQQTWDDVEKNYKEVKLLIPHKTVYFDPEEIKQAKKESDQADYLLKIGRDALEKFVAMSENLLATPPHMLD